MRAHILNGYIARRADGSPLAIVDKREPWGGATGIVTVTGRAIMRIEGARSAWDHVEIVHERSSSKGKLRVVEIQWYERNGVYVP